MLVFSSFLEFLSHKFLFLILFFIMGQKVHPIGFRVGVSIEGLFLF